MMALTIHQPFASAIVSGPKSIENRPWRCPDKHLGWIAVHAGKGKYPHDDEALAELWPEMPDTGDMPRGAIVGMMYVFTNSLAPPSEPWAHGPWCWVMAESQSLARFALDEPIECRGMQKLWTVPTAAEREILARWPTDRLAP